VRLLAILMTLAACSSRPCAVNPGESVAPVHTAQATDVTDTALAAAPDPVRAPITVSLSLSVVSDAGGDAGLSTQRSVAEVEAIAADIAPLWSQADVIFGLHHELFNQNRLMYSGTNGELLTDTEQAVARYGAQGIVDGVR
jgi:hypothetical protein